MFFNKDVLFSQWGKKNIKARERIVQMKGTVTNLKAYSFNCHLYHSVVSLRRAEVLPVFLTAVFPGPNVIPGM